MIGSKGPGIVNKIEKRFCELYDTDSLVYEVSELTIFCEC